MNKKKESSVARNIIIYGIGGALSQAAGLITLPIMTRHLPSFEYGAIEVITASTGYFALLIGLNTMSGLYRFFFEADESTGERKKMVSTTFLFVGICGLAIAIISCLISPFMARNLFGASEYAGRLDYAGAIRMAFIALIPVALYTYSLCLLRIQNKALPYIIIALVVSAIYMGCIIFFVIVLRVGIFGYYYAQIIANTIGAAIALRLSRRLLEFKFSRYWFKKLAKYSFPLVPGSLFAWSLSANNRVFLNASSDAVQVAYYGLANKATIVITLVTQAFCNAWEPTMYSLLRQTEKIRRILPSMLSLFTFGTLTIASFMMTIAKEIFLFLAPPEYLAGIGLLGIMQLRWLYTMGVYIIDPGTAKTGETWWVSIALGAAVLVNVGANLKLTPLFGLYGAVIAEALGYIAAMSGRWAISNRLFPVRWHYGYFILLNSLYGLTAWGQTKVILGSMPNAQSFMVRIALTAVFISIGWIFMDKETKETCFDMLSPIYQRLKKR